jgi:predicted metalloprotease
MPAKPKKLPVTPRRAAVPSDAALLARLPPLTVEERRRLVESALVQSKSGAGGVSHEDVMAWLASLDTAKPLPRPKARRRA